MSINQADVVDRNFVTLVGAGELPELTAEVPLAGSGLTAPQLVDLFESQIMSRHLDLTSRLLEARRESFYQVSSAGHEGNAASGMVFKATDRAFLHYGSGALLIQRQKQQPGSTPIWDMLHALVTAAEGQAYGSRHQVFGSLPLLVPPPTSKGASHLPKAVGMAVSIRRAQDLGLPGVVPHDSLVLCSFGDASLNHATALSALTPPAGPPISMCRCRSSFSAKRAAWAFR